ncbi:MAG: aspartate aminotransferase family protein [Candidatus Brocadiae bacterium]|nr:aspartate aminotransferase family protein [Candidatus Brocadiia bacterium]
MSTELYARHVNDQWVRLLQTLGTDMDYTRCEGTRLTTAAGREVLDFLSGYCVYNVGHNHPRLVAALHEELDRKGPTMLQSHVPPLAGELAARLTELCGKHLVRTVFMSTGSEGVETAIKFARAHTHRSGILHADGAFHGLTCGALSLMGGATWRADFEPLLPGIESIPFLDVVALEKKLATGRFAAFIVEPVQGENGILVPTAADWQRAAELCRRHGTLLVMDEVQTGIGRTGKFLATHHFGVEPDMVILAKALSGGLMPVSAVLMRDEICRSVYSSIDRALIHASTFGENTLSMRAALTVLDILRDEDLCTRAEHSGAMLREGLRTLAGKYEMVQEIRGIGLLNGIKFRPPSSLRLKLLYASFSRLHPAMFGQLMIRELHRHEGILTQICGNDFLVVKAAPPLTASEAEIGRFLQGFDRTLDRIHTRMGFWGQGLALAGRALRPA